MLGRRQFAGAKGFHIDAERVGDADGVGDLHFAAFGQTGGDNVFGDPAGSIGRAAVYFGAIFAAESAAAMPPHAAVGIDDDFAAGQTGVAHRAADDKAAGGIDENAQFVVYQFGTGSTGMMTCSMMPARMVVVVNFRGVLGADENGVDALGTLP
jgi:hypothetical protein